MVIERRVRTPSLQVAFERSSRSGMQGNQSGTGDNPHPVGILIATAVASAEVITEAFEGSLAQIVRGQRQTDYPSNDMFG
jgi:hypothetical protein